jgi:lipoprotein-releasing system ATP-binding protein
LARGVVKGYQDGERRVSVLRGVDLDVAPGELVGIVGPSGSGKSTLLHLLGGLDRGEGGEIRVEDQDLAQLSPTAMAGFRNRTVGFLFQFHQLLPDFSALENAMLPGRIAGLPAEECQARAESLLLEVGLDDRLHHYPNQLSGGERQRVALARALLLNPPLLLADEPTGNLDPETGDRVFGLLKRLVEGKGTTAILVTHNPAIAARCARILSLEAGVLKSRPT